MDQSPIAYHQLSTINQALITKNQAPKTKNQIPLTHYPFPSPPLPPDKMTTVKRLKTRQKLFTFVNIARGAHARLLIGFSAVVGMLVIGSMALTTFRQL